MFVILLDLTVLKYLFMTKAEYYFLEATKVIDPNQLDEKSVDSLLCKLVNCIPNNGLLYKYKNIDVDDDEFNKIFDPLTKGYIYLPSPNQMNDDIDTTFVYKTLHDDEDIYDYHFCNRYKIHYYNLKKRRKNDADRLFVLGGLAAGKDDITIASEFKKKSRKLYEKIAFVRKLRREIDELYDKKDNLKKFVESYNNLVTYLRSNLHIYCLTESYKQDSMWAYYGGKNAGLCIVYDFKKALQTDLKAKQLLISMGKIKYSDKKREIDILDIYDYIYSEKKSNKKYRKLSYKLSEALFVKRKSWKHEKEWRLMQNRDNNVIQADLVKGIILDKKVSDSKNAKKLIELSKNRGWFIKIRELNTDTMEYEYKKIN